MEIQLMRRLSVKKTGERFGTEELVKLFIYTGRLEDSIREVAEDDKVSWMEAVGIALTKIPGLLDIAQHAADIRDELLDLTEEEIKALSPTIAKAYQVKEDKVSEVLHDHILFFWGIINDTVKYVNRIKAKA